MARQNARRGGSAFGKKIGATTLALIWAFAGSACVHHVQIEPSDKPFVVNLNVKVDQEIRVKVEDQNRDLLGLESEMEGKLPGKTKAERKRASEGGKSK